MNAFSRNQTEGSGPPSDYFKLLQTSRPLTMSRKHELLTRSLRKMERTLDTVLRSIGNPSIESGMVSRSPSPAGPTASTQALIAAASPSPTPPGSPYQQIPPGSPKLHSLPDNALNPLGLLAEASLANRRKQNPNASPLTARVKDDDHPRVGVAADNYFKPGLPNPLLFLFLGSSRFRPNDHFAPSKAIH